MTKGTSSFGKRRNKTPHHLPKVWARQSSRPKEDLRFMRISRSQDTQVRMECKGTKAQDNRNRPYSSPFSSETKVPKRISRGNCCHFTQKQERVINWFKSYNRHTVLKMFGMFCDNLNTDLCQIKC